MTVMKLTSRILLALLLTATTAMAKKVKLTIDGILSPTQTTAYLIINEDTANAQRLAITDARFSVSITVDANDIIRIHDWKEWPERSVFVLLPDSRHITINWQTGTIEGSPLSLRMQEAIRTVHRDNPDSFHIDVFSDNKEDWAQARIREQQVRDHMLDSQRETVRQVIDNNSKTNIATWIAYCYSNLFAGGLDELAHGKHPKWLKHPILKDRK